jgi:hypothetical protein
METLEHNDGQNGYYSGYLQYSAAPLTGFLFALPLFLVYHAGLWWLNTFEGLRWANAVDIVIANWLGLLGMAGPLLSFILVIIVFLAMHAMAGKSWRRPPFSTWFLMVMESLVLALPVFMLSRLVMSIIDYLPLAAAQEIAPQAELVVSPVISWQANMVLSCGAGVYEEFFFRVLVMGLLALFLGKVCGLRGGWKYLAAAVLQALLFAASHHLPGGQEEIFSYAQLRQYLPAILFRTVAGLYFAFVYVERGFGISAGAHAGSDLMVVLLEMFAPVDATG